jgi:heterodisulfide reductase subunit B
MEESFGEKYNLPSLYVTQFLALAMGADRKKAGIGENKIDATKVLGAGNE